MNAAGMTVVLIVLMLSGLTSIWIVTRYLTASKRAKVQLTSGQDYRALAEEFRRLSDMAITAQEHVDLKLTEVSVQVESLRGQLEKMQHILTEVE